MPGDDQLLQRITVLPSVLDGRPCIRGSRVTVESVLDRLAQGVSPEAILIDHPDLELDDVFACTAYAQRIIAGHRRQARAVGEGAQTVEHTSSGGAKASGSSISLRELATRPPEEIDRVVQAVGIVVEADEIEAWDGTVSDGLDA